jgi:hypothetical protein
VDIEFIASTSVIAAEPAESRKLFVETLGLPQTVARLQSVDSLIVGISYAPWLHR